MCRCNHIDCTNCSQWIRYCKQPPKRGADVSPTHVTPTIARTSVRMSVSWNAVFMQLYVSAKRPYSAETNRPAAGTWPTVVRWCDGNSPSRWSQPCWRCSCGTLHRWECTACSAQHWPGIDMASSPFQQKQQEQCRNTVVAWYDSRNFYTVQLVRLPGFDNGPNLPARGSDRKTRNAWQSLACSLPGIAVLPPSEQ